IGDVTTEPPVTTEPKVTTTEPKVTTEAPITTPSQPIGDAIQFVVGEASGKAGETVTVPLSIKDNTGIAAAQFTYEIDGGLKITRVNKGDLGGSWTHSDKTNGLQFLSSDGENVTDDGVLGKLRVEIPEGTPDGIYYIKLSGFEATSYDPAYDIHKMIDPSQLVGVAGKIVVGNPVETTEPKVTEPPVTTEPKVTEPPVTTEPKVTEPPVTTEPKVTEPPVTDPSYGDVDGNGAVNSRDLLKLKQYILLAVDKSAVPNGDLNKDGTINTVDLIHLVKLLLG
ncbi:MAG: hypothetical protein E7505_09335, partial [Ruminococcus sp.]|nr:hypothetical protein [Ruminococcus sp.]